MDPLLQNVLTPADRRRALRTGALVVAVVAVLDGLLLRSPQRAVAWVAWVVLLVVAAELVPRVPAAAVQLVGNVAAVLSSVLLAALVYASGGSASPLFGVLPLIPALGAIIAPDDDATTPLLSAAFLVSGVALLVLERRPASFIALWAAPLLLTAVLVIRFSRAYRRRRLAAARAAQERADALDRLARSERELAKVERLARLPLLANGVAHDLNSPLAVVCSSIAFVRSEVRDPDPEVAGALTDAANAVAAMRRIVGDLQGLARLEIEHGAGAAGERATERALRDAVEFVAAQLGEGASVRAEIPDGLPVPVAPRHAVVDLLVQMVRAVAVVGGGEIVVRAERAPDGLSLAAGRRGAVLDATATLRGNGHVSICRAYADGLGARFRSVWDGSELRLGAVLPALQD